MLEMYITSLSCHLILLLSLKCINQALTARSHLGLRTQIHHVLLSLKNKKADLVGLLFVYMTVSKALITSSHTDKCMIIVVHMVCFKLMALENRHSLKLISQDQKRIRHFKVPGICLSNGTMASGSLELMSITTQPTSPEVCKYCAARLISLDAKTSLIFCMIPGVFL